MLRQNPILSFVYSFPPQLILLQCAAATSTLHKISHHTPFDARSQSICFRTRCCVLLCVFRRNSIAQKFDLNLTYISCLLPSASLVLKAFYSSQQCSSPQPQTPDLNNNAGEKWCECPYTRQQCNL